MDWSEVPEPQLLATLSRHLLAHETPLAALRRLGGEKGSKEAKSSFDEVTEIADELLNAGHYTVYQMKREELLRKSGIVVPDTAKQAPRGGTNKQAGVTNERGQPTGSRWELR